MALAHPGWAYAGALAAPIAVGGLMAVTRNAGLQGGNPPSPWWLVGGLGLAALGAHYYMNRAQPDTPGEQFAEGVALSTGPVALALGVALLLSPSMMRMA